jgi:hypothetical protein
LRASPLSFPAGRRLELAASPVLPGIPNRIPDIRFPGAPSRLRNIIERFQYPTSLAKGIETRRPPYSNGIFQRRNDRQS